MSHQQKPAEAHEERKRWIELSVPQLLAGALAAASAAVAASWLGVAGTVLGAVVASLVVSVSSALYARPIERSSQVIRESLPVIPVLPDRYRERASATTETRVLGGTAVQSAVADDETVVDAAWVDDAAETTILTDERPKRRISWSAVAVSSLAILVIGFGVLTAFEAVIGKSASSLTGGDGGGSTISRIVEGNSSGSNGSDSDNEKPTDPTKPGDSSDPDQPTDPKPTDPTPTEPTDPTPTEPTEPTPTEPTPTNPTPTQPSTPDAGDTVPQDGQQSQGTPGATIATDPA